MRGGIVNLSTILDSSYKENVFKMCLKNEKTSKNIKEVERMQEDSWSRSAFLEMRQYLWYL